MTKIKDDGCEHCGDSFEAMPFKCKFCEELFCEEHRLPEDHKCVGLEERKSRLREKMAKGEKITYTYNPKVRKEIKMNFDERENTFQSFQPRKNLVDPLLKSPMAIVGIVVAGIVILGFLIMLFL